MPSPVGHVLASVALGWSVTVRAAERRALRLQVPILAAVGLAPDLDLLVGLHSGPTHSLGAALLVASAAVVWRWPVSGDRRRIWLAVFLAWMVHPLLDALAPDGTAPYGVMMLWPFSGEYVQFDFTPFLPISRRYWLDGFVAHTVKAVAREILILGPLFAFVWWSRSHPARPR